jgi:hypothetical protein
VGALDGAGAQHRALVRDHLKRLLIAIFNVANYH